RASRHRPPRRARRSPGARMGWQLGPAFVGKCSRPQALSAQVLFRLETLRDNLPRGLRSVTQSEERERPNRSQRPSTASVRSANTVATNATRYAPSPAAAPRAPVIQTLAAVVMPET